MSGLTLRLALALLLAAVLPGTARRPRRDTEPRRVTLRFMAVNTPNKRYLLPSRARARALIRMLDRLEVDVCGCAEAWTALIVALRHRKAWRLVAARPNSVLSWGGVGNLLLVRRGPDDRLAARAGRAVRGVAKVRPRRLAVAMPGRRALSMATAVLVKNRVRVAASAAHFPTRGDAREATWLSQLRAVRDRLVDRAPNAVIMADFNRDRATIGHGLGNGWRSATTDQVMAIWCTDDVVVGKTGTAATDGEVDISDHRRAVWADLTFTEQHRRGWAA